MILFIFLPVIAAVLMVGALAKLAVFASRSGTLSWKHSLFFGCFLFVLTMAVRVALHFAPIPAVMPAALKALCGLALTTGFAAFYFQHHAVTDDREAISRAGAMKAAAVWAGFLLLFALPMLFLVPAP